MKKKLVEKNQDKDSLVTKAYLDMKLGQIDKKFAAVNKRIDRVIDYIDFKLKPLEEFKEEFQDFKDKVFTTLDWLVNAFKKFNEEHTISAEQSSRMIGQLEDHEKRISHLEERIITP